MKVLEVGSVSYLECIDRETNAFKQYFIAVVRTDTSNGRWFVMTAWGRIGARVQEKPQGNHASISGAEYDFQRTIVEKRGKGYVSYEPANKSPNWSRFGLSTLPAWYAEAERRAHGTQPQVPMAKTAEAGKPAPLARKDAPWRF
jgi:predicted DNA-binding WGR domain protein